MSLYRLILRQAIRAILSQKKWAATVLEQGVRLSIGAAGELDLLHHLVGAVVELLLRGDDAEQVDDEGQQQDGDEDEYYCAEIVGFTAFVFQGLCHIKSFLGIWKSFFRKQRHIKYAITGFGQGIAGHAGDSGISF